MTLPKYPITKIPDTDPPAVPSLWNETYEEIDADLNNLDARLAARESEIATARGGQASLDARLDAIEGDVEGLDPDMMTALVASVTLALSNSGLALREIEATIKKRFQQGRVLITNRGVISGCVVTKSITAARNLSLTAGRIFQGGRIIPVPEQINGASVPPNTTSASLACWVYLADDGTGRFDLGTTLLGEDPPDGAVKLYKIMVPAGNNESNDQFLANCTLSDQRRVESCFPAMLSTSPTVFVTLPYTMPDGDYSVDLEVVDFKGSAFELGYCYVGSRARNGFTIYYNGSADGLDVCWTARKLDM